MEFNNSGDLHNDAGGFRIMYIDYYNEPPKGQ